MDQLNTRLWLMINYLVRMIASRGTVYHSEITSLCWPPKLENKVAHMLSISWTVGKYIVSNLIKQPHPAKAGHNTTCTSSLPHGENTRDQSEGAQGCMSEGSTGKVRARMDKPPTNDQVGGSLRD